MGRFKKQEQLYDHFLEDLIDEVTYRRKVKELKFKKQELERKLENQFQSKNKTVLPTAQNLLELATELKSLWKMMSDDEMLIVVKRLCSNPRLTGANLCYDLRKLFEILKNLKKTEGNHKWCPLVDELRTEIAQ